MTESSPAYGLWTLVIINSAVFIFFAFSFIKPRTTLKCTDWKQKGSSHHITRFQTFDSPTPKGAGKLELIIREVGGVAKRIFTWSLPLEGR